MSFFNGIDHLDIKNGSFSVMRNVVYLKGNFDDLSPHSDDNAAFHDSHLPEYLQLKEGSFRVVRFIRRKGSARLFYEGPDIPISNFGEDPTTKEATIKRILAYLVSGVKHVDISGGTFSLQTTKTLASPFNGPLYVPQESAVHKKKASRDPKNIHIHGASFVESTTLIDSSDAFDSDHYGEFTYVVGLVDDTKIGFKEMPKNYLPGLSLFPGCRKMEILGGDFNITLTDLVFLDDEERFEPVTDKGVPQSRFPPAFNNGASQATPVTQTSINLTNVINQQSTIVVGGDNYSGNIEKSIVGGKGNSNKLTNNRGLGQEYNHEDDPHEGYAREPEDGDHTRERGGDNHQAHPRERMGADDHDRARERWGADDRDNTRENEGRSEQIHRGVDDQENASGRWGANDQENTREHKNGDEQEHRGNDQENNRGLGSADDQQRGGADDPENTREPEGADDEGQRNGDGENQGDGDGEGEGQGSGDPEGADVEGQRNGDGENQGDGEGEGQGGSEGEGEGQGSGDPEGADGEGQTNGDGENQGDGEGEGQGDGEGDGEGQGQGSGEGEGEGQGSGDGEGQGGGDEGYGIDDYPDDITNQVDWV